MILTILKIWLLLIVILSFINIKWGIALFLVYFILVPGFNIGISGLGTGQNVIILLICMAYLYSTIKNNYKTYFYAFSPFIILIISEIIVIPFQDMPIFENIDYARKNVMDLIISFLIYNIIKNDYKSLLLFRRVILFCLIVVIGYGLYLTTQSGANPYAIYMAEILNTGKDLSYYYAAEGTGRIFGRISSVFMHPMTFAFFLGCAMIYIFYLLNIGQTKIINSTILIAAIIISVLCGVRSILGGIIVAILYYVIMERRFKLLIYFGLGICAFSLIFTFLSSDLQLYIQSITNSSSTDVKGSSLDMRISQLKGAIDIMSQNPIFGLGSNWVAYYMSNHDGHPVCLAFESLVYAILCNSGLLGVIIWSVMIFRFFIINKKMQIINVNIVNMLMIFYISYSVITGEYGYMKYFLLFYVLILGESYFKTTNIHYYYEKS